MPNTTKGPTTPDWNGDEDDSSFETSTPEANRAIEAGQGVGARELAAQRDPTETAEHDPFKEQLAEDDDA